MGVTRRNLGRYATILVGIFLTGLLSACDAKNPKVVRNWEEAAQGIYTGVISTDGRYNLVGSLNHGVSLWRNQDQERLFDWNHRQGEFTALVAADFSPDGERAVTTDPRTLVLWDTTSGKALGFWATPSAAYSVALAPDGRHVLMGLEDQTAVYFDALSGTYGHTFLHQGEVYSVDLSGDGATALTGSEDNTAKLWSIDSGKEIRTFQHTNPVRVIALSQDGNLAFAAAQGREVMIWDATSGEPRLKLHDRNPGVTTAQFSPEGDELLVGYVNRSLELWDTRALKRLAHWQMKSRNAWHPTGSAIRSLGFSTSRQRYLVLTGAGWMYQLAGDQP